ncbi:MAG: OmpH family outer membrane protein [Puniceicoccales bacterium]|jgi:Skp family chaperone for outer membrane proteins|nr:OmpH family outer membrane protein [Puniceicoccales bacterium]
MRKFLFTAVAVIFLHAGAHAQSSTDLNILTVDMAQVYNSYDRAEHSKEQFQKAVEKAQEEMRAMIDEGVKAAKELQEIREKMDNPALSDSARSKLKKQADEVEDKVHKKEVEVNQFRQETDRELSQRREEFVARHIDEIKRVVKAVAEKRNVPIVLNTSGIEVLYSDSRMDVTDRVIKILNKSK